MDQNWKNFFDQEMPKEYMVSLISFIKERRKAVNVLPAPHRIFNAFSIDNWGILKVVMIGGEPYPSREDAHGLAFSSLSGQTPYSLKNIFDEIFQDVYHGNTGGQKIHYTNDLTQWADQGVFLLNSCLTVEEDAPGSHKDKGWELFIENAVKYISERHHYKIVFMLLGKEAKQYAKYINQERHLVLEADHPASARYNQNAWFGCKIFSQANSFISKEYKGQRAPINWGTWIKRK